MPSLSFLRRLTGLVAGALLVAAARPAALGAQVTRDWSVCFPNGVQACTDLFLTTAPQLVGATRTGTLVDVVVRQRELGSFTTGLQAFSFFFTPAGTGADATPVPTTPQALFGAPPAPAPDGWSAQGTSGAAAPVGTFTDVLLVRDTTTPFRDFPNPTATQSIAGCNGPLADAFTTSPLVSCGAGAYRFTFATAALFDADLVSELAVDVYVANADGAGTFGVAVCRGPAAGGDGVGFDPVDPFNAGAACTVDRAAAPPAVVPEPATLGLLSVGLVGVGLVGRRRRR